MESPPSPSPPSPSPPPPRRRKTCDSCGKSYLTNHYRRHRRTCKGPRKTRCDHCGKDFALASRLRRHLATCEKRVESEAAALGDANRRMRERLEEQEIQVRALISRLSDKDARLSEKDAQLRRKDEQLVRKDEQLAEKDEELRAVRSQLASVARPSATTVINLSVHMTPWCLDPSAPEYAACLRDDVAQARDAMASVAAVGAEVRLSDEYREVVNAGRRESAYFALARRVLASGRPRYIVPDLARRKGMFVMPDGSCRFDDGMSLLMRHQRRVFCDSGGTRLKHEARRRLRRALASDAHTAAKRIQRKEGRQGAEDDNGKGREVR